MEEKRNNEPQKKLSYEELRNAFDQVSHEKEFYQRKCAGLMEELNKANTFTNFKIVDYTFKVLELSKHFTPEFVSKCASRLEDFLSEPSEEPETEK